MALVMGLLVRQGYKANMSERSLRPIHKNAISLFGHGTGHLFLAWRSAMSSGPAEIFEGLKLKDQLTIYLPFLFVWYGFMQDKRRTFAVTMAFAIFHNTAQIFCIPTRFFFVHVLMAVLLGGALRGLAREPEDKDRYYAMEAALVDIPILALTFTEALTCDSFLIKYGGHVWFDMAVPFGFIVYYMILLCHPEYEKDADKKNQ